MSLVSFEPYGASLAVPYASPMDGPRTSGTAVVPVYLDNPDAEPTPKKPPPITVPVIRLDKAYVDRITKTYTAPLALFGEEGQSLQGSTFGLADGSGTNSVCLRFRLLDYLRVPLKIGKLPLTPSGGVGGITLRSIGILFQGFTTSREYRGSMRVVILAGDSKVSPPADFPSNAVIDMLPSFLPFDYTPFSQAFSLDSIEPSRFLYDALHPLNEVFNYNEPLINLRLGGPFDANICIYFIIPRNAVGGGAQGAAGAGKLDGSGVLMCTYLDSFIPTRKYPQKLSPQNNRWITDLSANASKLEVDFSNTYQSGMYWPVPWSHRVANSEMLKSFEGVSRLMDLLGKRALACFPIPDSQKTFSGGALHCDDADAKPLLNDRISGGDPALGLTKLTRLQETMIGFSGVAHDVDVAAMAQRDELTKVTDKQRKRKRIELYPFGDSDPTR